MFVELFTLFTLENIYRDYQQLLLTQYYFSLLCNIGIVLFVLLILLDFGKLARDYLRETRVQDMETRVQNMETRIKELTNLQGKRF